MFRSGEAQPSEPCTFQGVLGALVFELARCRPFHTVPILIALENGRMDHKAACDTPKVVAAEALLHRCGACWAALAPSTDFLWGHRLAAVGGNLSKIVPTLRTLCQAYVALGLHTTPTLKDSRGVPVSPPTHIRAPSPLRFGVNSHPPACRLPCAPFP